MPSVAAFQRQRINACLTGLTRTVWVGGWVDGWMVHARMNAYFDVRILPLKMCVWLQHAPLDHAGCQHRGCHSCHTPIKLCLWCACIHVRVHACVMGVALLPLGGRTLRPNTKPS